MINNNSNRSEKRNLVPLPVLTDIPRPMCVCTYTCVVRSGGIFPPFLLRQFFLSFPSGIVFHIHNIEVVIHRIAEVSIWRNRAHLIRQK